MHGTQVMGFDVYHLLDFSVTQLIMNLGHHLAGYNHNSWSHFHFLAFVFYKSELINGVANNASFASNKRKLIEVY